MGPAKPPEALIQAERSALRALCQGMPAGDLRAEALRLLQGYTFADNIHQLIFDTLQEIPSDDPKVIRAQLPVRLNNKGFPYLDLEAFFVPPNLSAQELITLVRALRNRPSGAS